MSPVDVELAVVGIAVAGFLTATAISFSRRPEDREDRPRGGYQQWLEENRSGINLYCDDCGRGDGTHGPDCPDRLLG